MSSRKVSRFTHYHAILKVVTLLISISIAPGAVAQGTRSYDDLQSYTMIHGGVERTFGLYVPKSRAPGTSAPMIVAIHGRFSSAKALHALSKLRAVAEARGAVLLYPETRGPFWDDGGHQLLARNAQPNDDMGFIQHAIDSIASDYGIERSKIFLVGHDAGASMAFRLHCQGQTRFAALGIISSLMWRFTATQCSSAQPGVPVLFIHGQESDYFPTAGISPSQSIGVGRLSARDTVSHWVARNGCQATPTATGPGDSVYFASCANGGSIAYVGVQSARQDWPRVGAEYRLNNHGVSASSLLEDFLFDRTRFHLPSSQTGDRNSREYIVFTPPHYDAAKPTPVLFVLHGRPSNAAAMARISDMNSTAVRNGFIVIYPQGLNNEWNAQFDLFGKSSRSAHTSGKDRPMLPQDDVGFLKNLAQDLSLDLNIDRQRMFISGFSNGGFMTLRMACSASDTFAGFAEVGAALYSVLVDFCKGGKPAPIMFMHGSEDRSISIDGVRISDPNSDSTVRVTLSVKESVAHFARRNGCETSGTQTTFGESGRSPGTRVVRYIPKNCNPQAPIALYIIEGGGHTWPGVTGVLDETTFGKTNMDINASDKIWEFLSQQRLSNQ